MPKKSFSDNLSSVENPAYLFTGAPQKAEKENVSATEVPADSHGHIIPSRERRDRRLQLLLPQSLYDSIAQYAALADISVNETIVSTLQRSFAHEKEGGEEQ